MAPTAQITGNTQSIFSISGSTCVKIKAYIRPTIALPTTPPTAPGGKTEEVVQPPVSKGQKVLITFDLPEGTQITLDGKDISGSTDVEVTVGKHSLELKHALLDLDYDKNLKVFHSKLNIYRFLQY